MAQVKRLTRAEKIAQSSALKKETLSDPRHLLGLEEGTRFKVSGDLASLLKLPEGVEIVVAAKSNGDTRKLSFKYGDPK